ncbi:MAG: hypothetical protein U1G08_04380 [Verrucomicrobiota bacterium]
MTAAPAGDSINDPIRFGGYSWTALLDSNSATAEANEPSHASRYGDAPWETTPIPPEHSLWCSWTAPISGSVWCIASIHMTPPHLVPEAFLAVYTNDATGSLVRVASQNSFWLLFTATAGVEYRLVLDVHGKSPWAFNVGLICGEPLPPINDAPSQAWDLSSSRGFAMFDLLGANHGPEDPDFGFFLKPIEKWWQPVSRGGNSVWYVWIAPSTGLFDLEVAMFQSYPQLAVFQDTLPGNPTFDFSRYQLTELRTNGVANQQFGLSLDGRSSLRTSINASRGDRFLFLVDQCEAAGTAPFITPGAAQTSEGWISITDRLPNDDLADAATLESGHPVLGRGGATSEPGEESIASGTPLRSWWWTWTSERAEAIRIIPPEAQVFTGTTFADLQPVRMSRVGVGGQYAGFEATPGTRYLLRVARSNSSPVEVMLIRGSVADRRTEAVELRLQNGLTQGVIPRALLTVDPDEPGAELEGITGVGWATWSPTIPGRYRLRSIANVRAFRGNADGSLAPVSPPWSNGRLAVEVKPGERFWFAVANRESERDTPATIVVDAPTASDAFETPQEIQPGVLEVLPDLIGTSEPLEPSHGGLPAFASRWYRWKCAHSGRYTLAMGGPQGPRAAVYQGDSLPTLRPILAWRCTNPLMEGQAWNATEGETYRIAIEPGDIEDPGVQWMLCENGLEEYATTALRTLSGTKSFHLGLPEREPFDNQVDTPPGYGSKWFRHPANTFPPPVRVLVILESEAVWRQDRPPLVRLFRKSSSGEYFMIGSSAPLHDRGWVAAQGPAIPGGETQIQVAFPEDAPFFSRIRIQQLFDGPRPAPTPPVLSGLRDHLQLTAPVDTPFRIEWSRDLRTWNAAGDAIGQSPHVNLALPDLGAVPAFFRAVND